jgi:hypothetical protein
MTMTQVALQMLVYSPFNKLSRLLVPEYFIEFSHGDTFKLYMTLASLNMVLESRTIKDIPTVHNSIFIFLERKTTCRPEENCLVFSVTAITAGSFDLRT